MTTIQADQYLSLSDVAKLAPGRQSANCVWRWCRKGVKARGGDRVRLQHMRMGGQIYTTQTWLKEFGTKLAEADSRYFELSAAFEGAGTKKRVRSIRSFSQVEQQRRKAIEDAERELSKVGI